jgi:hypothetical protein
MHFQRHAFWAAFFGGCEKRFRSFVYASGGHLGFLLRSTRAIVRLGTDGGRQEHYWLLLWTEGTRLPVRFQQFNGGIVPRIALLVANF